MLLCVFPAMFSCIEDLDLNSGEDMLVVDCVLKMDTIQHLKLYHLNNLYTNDFRSVQNATVELFKEAGDGVNYVKIAEFTNKGDIDWVTRYIPEHDTKYKLSVSVNGKETISAYTKFPDDLRVMLHTKTIIDSLRQYGEDIREHQMITAEVCEGKYVNRWGNFKIFYRETPFKVYQASQKACKMWIFPHTDSTIVMKPDNNYSIFQEEDVHFSGSTKPYVKHVVTDHPFADSFNIVDTKINDLRFFQVPYNSHILRLSSFSTIVNINISQWCAYALKDLPVHKEFIRIDQPKAFNNGVADLKNSYQFSENSFLLFGDYENYQAGIEPFVIEVRFLSDEYDRYLREAYMREKTKNDFILSVYGKENLYTNINGGLGIFGAEYTTWAEPIFRFDPFWWLGINL